MDSCELVPGKGIRCGDAEIYFGMARKALREMLGWKPTAETLWDDEDEYMQADGEDWLRLRFLDGKLCDIEVLGGGLQHEGLELKSTSWSALEPALETLGHSLRKTQWLGEGKDCVALHVNIATHDDVGGDGDGIEWVITSSDFHNE